MLALITGGRGQDGRIMIDFLQKKNILRYQLYVDVKQHSPQMIF